MKLNIRKWLDGFSLAGKGILLVSREKRFLIWGIAAFLFFGTLMNLLSNGLSKFQLMGMVGFWGSLELIFEACLMIFGIGISSVIDFFLTLIISLIQGILIGMIAFLWQKKRQAAEHVEKVGIITGLIALGAGCPTCGTTLITPLIGAFAGAGGMAMAGTMSGLITALAFIIAILSLKRLGEECYVIIVEEKYRRKKEALGKNA